MRKTLAFAIVFFLVSMHLFASSETRPSLQSDHEQLQEGVEPEVVPEKVHPFLKGYFLGLFGTVVAGGVGSGFGGGWGFYYAVTFSPIGGGAVTLTVSIIDGLTAANSGADDLHVLRALGLPFLGGLLGTATGTWLPVLGALS